ncbi:Gfo/Idh/MocA family oxidoreductase [Bacillus mobilis]|uniref:Oxidoreductase n=2 Tax=Bacillus cereus group TaxID=86661 RepID=A0A1C4E094_BACCE|nr:MULTISPECIES: Gfo/Idh/MocA family oxidoreductase [Bacillus cereus group]MCC2462902.1 Gfo/Idh/MocA family oxidoreductase [Bacillus mobilis]MCU5435023.1 Gfo/Idh/MocA family oxidoreductase [Bacillus mobilis]MCU5591071.1 Gfo/Idh/MocA family oxidoreductase [Bacillus mobilis]MCU5737301.1 Gfo/Idh/MocA family oxidoreductase [Bacillus mobilis]MCU9558679.1 Gfo/Idh/MocA family oxidoreductase [Bacillus mobilis]
MRVGIIGGGFGFNVQAPIINTHPRMKVSAVSTMMRHQLPKELSTGDNSPVHYTDWTKMLDLEELDLVFVSSLPIYHFEMVKYALNKDINVVCEKPFTMNSRESEELLKLSKDTNAKVFIDFEWRYHPARQKVKELINEVGDILHFEYHISASQYQNLQTKNRGWMGEKQKFGGMLGAIGTHMIDCLSWLIQDKIITINSLIHTHVPQGPEELRDSDDAFFIHGKMEGNCTFSIQLISGIHHGSGSNLKVFGSLGTINLIDDKTLFFGKASENLEEIKVETYAQTIPPLSPEAIAYYPAFYPFLDKVYENIIFNKLDKDLPTIVDGHENQIIIDSVLSN